MLNALALANSAVWNIATCHGSRTPPQNVRKSCGVEGRGWVNGKPSMAVVKRAEIVGRCHKQWFDRIPPLSSEGGWAAVKEIHRRIYSTETSGGLSMEWGPHAVAAENISGKETIIISFPIWRSLTAQYCAGHYSFKQVHSWAPSSKLRSTDGRRLEG